MGLRSLIPTLPVKLSDLTDSSLTVRGFSPDDAIAIYHRHRGELSALFDELVVKAKSGSKKADDFDVTAILLELITSVPVMMAEIIVIAGTEFLPEHDEFEAAVADMRMFSIGVQLDALQKIAALTFTSDMPPGKFLAVVLKMAGSAAAVAQVRAA